MIVSDIILKRKCPTADVTMNNSIKITDVYIYNLAHFADFSQGDFRENILVLKTDADVIPHIKLSGNISDCMVKLISDEFEVNICVYIIPENSLMELHAELNKLLVSTSVSSGDDTNFIMDNTTTNVCCYCLLRMEHDTGITTEVSKPIYETIKTILEDIKPIISADVIPLYSSVTMNTATDNAVAIQSEIKILIIPLVKDYDDWLISDMDDYTLYDLEKEKE